jgi:hypothetical protein
MAKGIAIICLIVFVIVTSILVSAFLGIEPFKDTLPAILLRYILPVVDVISLVVGIGAILSGRGND